MYIKKFEAFSLSDDERKLLHDLYKIGLLPIEVKGTTRSEGFAILRHYYSNAVPGFTGYFTIKDNNIIDVEGNVYLREKDLTYIPFKFGKVTGNFNCSSNYLTSLKGCPQEVGGDFICSNNSRLINLIGGPDEVGGSYTCSDNNLISLEGCASEIGSNLKCNKNKLIDLDISSVIGGYIYCQDNNIDPNNYHFYGECDEVVFDIMDILNRPH